MRLPERIVAGEMHYARVPRAYWRARFEMAAAMGVSAVSTYVFWNLHEPSPGRFRFDGECDVAEFVRLAGEVGLGVVLRPGPYVCAEWDFGGLPAWLLAGAPIRVRSTDPAYLGPVRAWLLRLGRELAPLQRARGGPILAVQLENEYGAFGRDRAYLEALRAIYDDAGFGVSPYFTIDQPRDLADGSLPDLQSAVTCGVGDAVASLEVLRRLRPDEPLFCAEYWAGWFDHWGEPHAERDLGAQADDLRALLRAGASVNVYMLHGGTNVAFNGGANGDEGTYQPDATSYDYLAAIDEAGRPTEKYAVFRAIIAQELGNTPRPVPPAPRTMEIAAFPLRERARLAALCREPVRSEAALSMEALGQSFGYVLYRARLPSGGSGALELDAVRDFVTVSVDGEVIGHLDRRLGERSIALENAPSGARLDLLVENCGRINYGPSIGSERKGIVGAVRWRGDVLKDWETFTLPFDDLARLVWGETASPAPGFARGTFYVAETSDTFFDMRAFGKGVLFINGHNAGRFWNVGAQRALYVPGAWLRVGTNQASIFDVMPMAEPTLRGLREPIYSEI